MDDEDARETRSVVAAKEQETEEESDEEHDISVVLFLNLSRVVTTMDG